MKTKWLLMMLMVVGLMAGAAQANMLANPDFEEGTFDGDPGTYPPDWLFSWPDTTSAYTWLSGTGAHSGTKYMRIQPWYQSPSYNPYMYQPVTGVIEGKNYEFSVWAKNEVEDDTNEGQFYLDWSSAGGWMSSTGVFIDVTSTEWTKLDFGTFTAPGGAVAATFWFGVNGYNPSATNVDDAGMFDTLHVRYPSPYIGETVTIGDVDLSWTNADPNYEGHSVYVDVWFGTEPNVTDPGYDMTKKVTAGENMTTVQVSAPTEGTYYWRVNSYRYGPGLINEPNAIEGPLWSFNTVDDAPPSSVDAGVNMITWSGEPVSLDATIVDDGVSALTYLWTAVPADGVVITEDGINPDNTATKEAKVTIDKSGNITAIVTNPGFESPKLNDGGSVATGAVPGWKEGWYNLSNPDVWVVESYSAGVINPDAAYGYGGAAAEGENVAYAAGYTGYDMGLSQILSVALQADTQYVLSAKVGNPYAYNEGLTNDYRIELVAGDVVLETDTGPSPNGTTDPCWVDVSLTHNSGSVSDPNVGRPLEIRLVTVDDGSVGYEVNFDDVKLTATPAYPFPAVHTVTLTLAVNDESNPTPVTDSMTIDVYDDECQAARIGLSRAAENPGDIDEDCDTDLKDLSLQLSKWLVGSALTEMLDKL